MIRRFNYTDRQKIPREQVRLEWIEDNLGPLKFKGTIDLTTESPLDPSALIFVEAHSGPVVMRFPFGSVSSPVGPPTTALDEFVPGLKPLFRVKVVEATSEGRILAWADNITPLSPDEVASGRRSILPVETVDLGAQVWRLRIESNQFRLQLNSNIRRPRDITQMARDPDFIALVYPSLIRQVLNHLYFGPESASVDESNDWLAYGQKIAKRPAPLLSDEHPEVDDESWRGDVQGWIEDVITGFCQQNEVVEAFVGFKQNTKDSDA